jgi:hypothetical protein
MGVYIRELIGFIQWADPAKFPIINGKKTHPRTLGFDGVGGRFKKRSERSNM